MNCKNGIRIVLLLAAIVMGISSPLWAAAKSDDQANHWGKGLDRFSAFGVVESTDTAGGTLTVSLEGTSRRLKDANGSSFVFHVQDPVRVSSFGGALGKGGIPAGGKMGKHGNHLTLADVESKDNILVSGFVDAATDHFVVTRMVIWLY
jgi:hypothetical protein